MRLIYKQSKLESMTNVKIKIKTTETKEVEKELELPYYFKLVYGEAGNMYYAIFDEKRSMRVNSGQDITCFAPSVLHEYLSSPQFAPSTSEEFTEAYETTIRELTAMMPQTV